MFAPPLCFVWPILLLVAWVDKFACLPGATNDGLVDAGCHCFQVLAGESMHALAWLDLNGSLWVKADGWIFCYQAAPTTLGLIS